MACHQWKFSGPLSRYKGYTYRRAHCRRDNVANFDGSGGVEGGIWGDGNSEHGLRLPTRCKQWMGSNYFNETLGIPYDMNLEMQIHLNIDTKVPGPSNLNASNAYEPHPILPRRLPNQCNPPIPPNPNKGPLIPRALNIFTRRIKEDVRRFDVQRI